VQCDKKSFWKIAQNVAQAVVRPNLMQYFLCGKKQLINCNIKKLPKRNNRQIGESSPNLVTPGERYVFGYFDKLFIN
jgi:hypothetical protein